MPFSLDPVTPTQGIQPPAQPQQQPDQSGFTLTPVSPQQAASGPTAKPAPSGNLVQGTLDFLHGFNAQIAQAAGTSIENIDKLYKTVSGNPSLYGNGGVWGAMKAAGHAIGLNLDAADDMMGHLGSTVANSALMTGALIAGHPEAAASSAAAPMRAAISGSQNLIQKAIASGATTVNGVIESLGKQFLTRPYLSTAQELGGDLGYVHGHDATMNETGDSTAADLAGTVESVVGASLAGSPLNIARAGRRMPHFGRGSLSQEAQGIPDTPLMGDVPDKSAIAQSVAAAKNEVENGINKAISGFTKGKAPDPATAAENIQSFIRGPAFKRGRDIESGYWRDVNTRGDMDGQDLRGYLAQLIKNEPRSTLEKTIPGTWVSKIRNLGKYKIGENADTGEPMYGYKPYSAREILAIRSQMDHQMRTGVTDKGAPMSPEMRRNYKLISDQILATVERAKPQGMDMKAWSKARDYSSWFNDQFTRGPLSKFTGPYEQEANLPDAQPGAERLVTQPRAGRQMAEIRQKLPSPEINKLTQSYISNRVAEIANAQGPAAAQKYIAQPRVQRFMKNFPKVAQNMQDASDALTSALADQKAFNASKYLGLADEAPEVATQRLFNSPKMASEVREITRRINDPHALQAFKDSLIEHMINIGNAEGVTSRQFSPSQTLKIISRKPVMDGLSAVFTSKELGRLQRILRAGATLEGSQGKRGFGGATGQNFSTFLGRLYGTKLGQLIPGGTSLVIQGRLSQAGATFAQKIFSSYPASTLVARAVQDPRWETLLMSKMPERYEELVKDTKMFKNFARVAPSVAGMADRMRNLQEGDDNGQ